jgi:hypothetical protein
LHHDHVDRVGADVDGCDSHDWKLLAAAVSRSPGGAVRRQEG